MGAWPGNRDGLPVFMNSVFNKADYRGCSDVAMKVGGSVHKDSVCRTRKNRQWKFHQGKTPDKACQDVLIGKSSRGRQTEKQFV